ncbi:DUF3102 domain-containing protein [Methylobacterium sp. BTF04]|uniref:DUF3102 domain-containing protein n=1 Tax=Methylobacterium sp. BTF04 TaxID=2708300 RepID=UPI0013D848E4|nr:DUF3102 domain-containing protein [Methylobacterium sp. BTF04]NEU14634.1 DUF3102 domain-containing protein [Methylobacterium sp. BTF04]
MSDALTVPAGDRLEEIAVEIETIQGVALLKIGERLSEARDIFKYDRNEGGFTGWIDARLKFGSSTAYKLIDVFTAFGNESFHKMETLPKSVLYALAAPSTPEPVREEAIRRVEAGQPVDLDLVADLKRQLLDAKQLAKDAKRDEKVQKDLARQAQEDRAKMLRDYEWAKSEVETKAREIERLKQDGVIHVYPAEPKPVAEIKAAPVSPKPGSCLPAMAAIIADGCRRDVAELVAMAREEGLFSLAAELEALVSSEASAA